MTRAKRNQPKAPLRDRLLQEAHEFRHKASLLPLGSERDAMIRNARHSETASHMDEWLSSPGLQAPK
jgi:hypothetical protein